MSMSPEDIAAAEVWLDEQERRQDWIRNRGIELFAMLDERPGDPAIVAEVEELMAEMRDRAAAIEGLRQMRLGRGGSA